ncbi:MAG: long-chain fatty acid--CoA ligase [Syntrophales bacterium]|jgi:long-chain acyl-CoA synthetase|nr:long-chain fatty acid--CoA ligase [Syntrophales bacterium]HOG06629.1 long-chain fatty acid--CoA ligase [Syntrophales bacterium]HOS78402.1 long-chain fatty acid--CoA ligase [Syntrophales bacterium]HPB69377.1 long-chain fatty acid--CoA ligase [Syntrophales bacterium]HQN25912.1 long-chain fatty acid--CoA ligase [Syntrophales bacterium]
MKLAFANIRDMVETQAHRYGDRIAIRYYERDITYRELDEGSNRVANGLLKLGVRKGERVCILMDNSPEFYEAYFGIIKIGAIAGPVNCWWQTGEIQYLLNDSGAVALFCDHVYRGHVDKILDGTPALKHVIEREATDDRFLKFEDLRALAADLTPVGIDLDDVATIVYTSGTTGNPKGVLLTHRNILTNSWQASLLANIDENDVIMCFLPLFHVNGLVITGTSPLSKGSQIILRRNFSASEFWECVAKYRVSIFSGVPTVYQILLNTPGFEGVDVSSLRYGVCGAAPMPVEAIRKFEETFNMIIIEGYGLTEGTAGATANPIDGVRKIGSIGIPFAESEIRLFDEQDREVSQGEVGEICIKGDHVMKGYFNKPEETAQTLRGGWLHTGDMAYKDEEGYLFIVDRKKEMIIRGGENIYPKELEGIIYRHPQVMEVAVVGSPDPIYGEEVMACLVLHPGQALTEEAFKDWCRANMASYKVPKYVDIRTALPKNILGKILKKELKSALKAEGKITAA